MIITGKVYAKEYNHKTITQKINIMKGNWKTEHDQSRSTMTHTFRKGVRITVSWKQLTLTIERYQKTLDVFPITGEHYTIAAHERLLGEVERITSRKCFSIFRDRDTELKNLRSNPKIFIGNF